MLQAGKSCALIGPAGIGKTALATQALCGAQLSSLFEDGVLWLDASGLDMASVLWRDRQALRHRTASFEDERCCSADVCAAKLAESEETTGRFG